jgi:hypothetical protein
MASVTIKTNIGKVITSLGQDLETIFDKNYLLRPVAIEVMPLMTQRIHQDGKASDGSQIGTYSNGYMVVRTGSYKNAGKITRGKNKGKLKDSGVKSKQRVATPFGKSAYAYQNIEADRVAREKYNRSSDTKVIVSLTRQLENDWSVLETPKGYGIGFTNSFNADKLSWVEEVKDKVIGALTQQEIDYAFDRINELVANALNR